jgi:hypothetical protein
MPPHPRDRALARVGEVLSCPSGLMDVDDLEPVEARHRALLPRAVSMSSDARGRATDG